MKNIGAKVWARIVSAAVLLIAAVSFGTTPAYAHDALLTANPSPNSEVTEFPSEIVMTFSGQIQPDFNTVAVSYQESSEVLFDIEPTLDGQNVIIPVPEGLDTPAGTYVVGYQVTSSDGHAIRGSFSFRLVGDVSEDTASASTTAASESATQEAQDAAESSESGSNNSVIWIAIIVVVLAALGAVFFLRKR